MSKKKQRVEPKFPQSRDLTWTPQTILILMLLLGLATVLAELYRWVGQGWDPSWYGALIVNSILAVAVLVVRFDVLRARPVVSWRLMGLLYFPAVALALFPWLMILLVPGNATMNVTIYPSDWLMLLAVPVVEEIVFRVGLGDFCRRRYGLGLGGYLSAVLFGYVHSLPTWDRLWAGEVGVVFGPLLLGLACEFLYSTGRRLLPIVMLHMAGNASVIIFRIYDPQWLERLHWFYLR